MNLFTLFSTRFEHLVDQRLSRESLHTRRIKKFRKLVAYAREHSPYYARIIENNGIDPAQCRPEDFPVTTKREIMDHFDEVVTDRRITKERVENFLEISKNPLDLFAGNFRVVHTSGSSGEKGIFVYSQKDWARGIAHALRLNNFSLKRQRIAFIGSTEGHFAGVSFVSSIHEPLISRFFRVQTYEINSPLDPIIDRLNAYQPNVLIGYATALAALAEKQLKGSLKIRPSVVESGGEPLNSGERSVIEMAFQAPILNLYMSSEHMYMGIGKPDYYGMYLLEDDLIFEIQDDHTCVTNLFNYTMPLIRYKMNDILIPEADEDGDLPFTKVRNIVGRNEHMPVFTNKHGADDFISPHVISGFVVKHLRRFQLVILDKKSFLFKANLEEGLRDTQLDEVLREIKSRLFDMLSKKDFDNVSFEIQVVNDLPVDKNTGKFRLILPQDNHGNATSRLHH